MFPKGVTTSARLKARRTRLPVATVRLSNCATSLSATVWFTGDATRGFLTGPALFASGGAATPTHGKAASAALSEADSSTRRGLFGFSSGPTIVLCGRRCCVSTTTTPHRRKPTDA